MVAQENRILPSDVTVPFIAAADLPALRSGNASPPGLADLQVRVQGTDKEKVCSAFRRSGEKKIGILLGPGNPGSS